jgi:hypothetical protein
MQIEQKVVTVPNEDADINALITAQAADSWVVSSIKVYHDDTTVIVLFQKVTS